MYNFIKSTLKFIFIRFWKKIHSGSGNIHMPFSNAKVVSIPFKSTSIYIRPTDSDVGRVEEYLENIYFKNSYLHLALKSSNPTTLIDIGANIGLSSLSLLEEFPTLTQIVAIEAEEENFLVLDANFKLFKKKYPNVNFKAINAVATSGSNVRIKKSESLANLTGENGASGTFRFDTIDSADNSNFESQKCVGIEELFNDFKASDKVIVKMDIEGGEEHLLSENTDWVNRCFFLTLEVHDKFHPVMLNSSKNIIKVLHDGDFAIAASNDVLHCYNRSKLF